MAQDPVLQREMFNPRDRSARGSGITSMVDDGSSGMTREERLQMAKAMLAEARMKQSPEYYFKTLAQGDRPAMTRPVASSAPPPAMQPIPPMQQMAQMQAAGVRPVGMADGGIVRRGFYAGGINTVDPRMTAVNLADLPAFGAVESSDNPSPATGLGEEPSKWTDAEIEKHVADTTDSSNTSEVTRKIRTLKNTRDQSRVNESAIQQREMIQRSERDAPTKFTTTPMSDKEKADIRRKTESAETFSFQPVPVSFPGRDDRLEADPTTDPTKIAAGRLQMAEQGIAAARPTFEPPSGDLNLNQLVNSEAEKESVQFAKDKEAKGIASLRNMESGLDLGRRIADVEDGGDIPLIVNQGVAERAERKAIRIPEDPTLQGKATIPGVPGAAAARDAVAQGQAGAGGGAAAQEPAKYSATTTLESIKSERAKEREDNFNMALIQAGLAMMGGKSSNALANIGEGGMQGIKQFAEQEREATRGYREDVKGVREEERFARAEERAAAATKEEFRRFDLTYGEGIRQFDENARRQNRQQEISEDQFKKTFGVTMANAARADKQFAATHGLSVQAARQNVFDQAKSFELEEQKLAINREELLQRAEESKEATVQAIASRDAKKLESAAGLASQILNATQARIANLLSSQKENSRMGLEPDPAVVAEVQELQRQAQEARSNYYAVQRSLGIDLPGSNVVEYGTLSK